MFKDIDKGYAKAVKTLTADGKLTLTVGVHDSEMAAQRGKTTIGLIASVHEFGSPENNIPARSFIGAWFDAQRDQNADRVKAIANQVAKGAFTARVGLERLGLFFVGQIQARIAAGLTPALKPETVARKGSSTPLIDTGVLRSSIRSRVTESE